MKDYKAKATRRAYSKKQYARRNTNTKARYVTIGTRLNKAEMRAFTEACDSMGKKRGTQLRALINRYSGYTERKGKK